MKKYKNYEIVQTEDGSNTLYSKLYSENCHSTSGALNETVLHYVEGCRIEKRINSYTVFPILEVGFGTGLGFIETSKIFEGVKAKLIFVSFEIDKELVEIFAEKYKINFSNTDNIYSYKKDNIELHIYLGNARETIKTVKKEHANTFKAIYQDAFSPKRNSILWTTEWFKDLKNLADEDCIISTYSASSSIRKSMIAAGWKLYPGDQFGVKRTSTRGRLTGTTDPELLDRVSRSPVPEITDSNYKEYTL